MTWKGQCAASRFSFEVEPAVSAFCIRPTEQTALTAAQALWSMRDWLVHEFFPALIDRDHEAKAKKEVNAALTEDFELLRDWVELEKHAKLTRTSVKVVGLTGRGVSGLEQI